MTEQEHMETTPESNAERRAQGFRLTEADEKRVRVAVAEYYDRLAHGRAYGSFVIGGDQIEAMRRVGAASIGCGLHDLRDVELAWLDREVESTISPF